ncbi:hypothetical protein [Phytomonospora endophytica]|uniref:Uncharacterized protein n=1 Tax=Phytomonospora endophytica TaxID=714109 RepID=A0A841FZN8_9ACTN|nr:hypothetical protein [Phytomonospora endophytica]MBB6037909.1 hypothetical protein [Phytomonospora endophytica]
MAVQEVDWSTWRCDPPHPAWDELKTHIAPVFGGDVHIGGKLPALLTAAGLQDVHTAHHAFRWRRGDRYQTLLLHFTDLFAGRMLHSGDLSADRLHALTTGLADHLDRPGTTVQESLFVQAWGRRPGAEAP